MVEVQFLVPESQVEAVSDALMEEFAALSVSVEDADADTPAENALYGEPGLASPGPGWLRSRVKALFDAESLAREAAAQLLARPGSEALKLVGIVPVPEQDWVRLTQSQFEPVQIARDFWIVPSWHEPPAAAQRVIRLDPGLAFGTGTHATTRMCLRWIAGRAGGPHPPWQRVLDYGCGSGILAIAASLFGAGAVDAVDIDPAAVASARANALSNGAAINAGTPDVARGEYALVLANILATPLKLLAPLLCAHLQPAADLVLAGILERQADELVAAYAPWCALEVTDVDEGWILMTGRRRD